MKRFLILLLCFCLLLTACKGKSVETEPSTEATTVPTTQATTEATTIPTEAPTEATVAPTEAPVLYQHPLTGEMMEVPMQYHPVAVSTNNYSPAQPVLGISHADFVFEHVTEGGGAETRMLAIYTNLNFDGQVGTVRSARTYSIEMAKSFYAFFVHCGGSALADNVIKYTRYPSFNQFFYADYFYRDADRRAAGYSSDHTLVADAQTLLQGLSDNGFDIAAPENPSYGLVFSDEPTASEDSAEKITAQFYSDSGKKTIFSYDKDQGVYYGHQIWSKKQADILDGNTMDMVPFKNIVILRVVTTLADDGNHRLMDLTSGGEGYFACNGTYVPIKWSRNAENNFVYTLEDGSPVEFGVGKTYVVVLPTKSPAVIFE